MTSFLKVRLYGVRDGFPILKEYKVLRTSWQVGKVGCVEQRGVNSIMGPRRLPKLPQVLSADSHSPITMEHP